MKRAAAWALGAVLLLGAPAPAAAQERDSETLAPESGPWDLERAFIEMERLQAEVVLLRRLGEAQAALLAWNRERAETLGTGSGAGPVTLAAHLCREDGLGAWCLALPATFGVGAATATNDGHGKDGER